MAILVRRFVSVVVLLTCIGSSARAQDMEVPVAVQLPLFLKVMSFDRHLGTRAEGAIVVAIAYQSGFRLSAEVRDEAFRATKAMRELAGLPMSVVAIDLDRETLSSALARTRATVLYITPLRGVDVKELATTTRVARVTTVTGVVRYVEGGLSVGVRLKGDRPRIVINLDASRAEGADFSAELLKLAQVL